MKLKQSLFALWMMLLLAGCSSYRNVPYLQNPQIVNNFGEELSLYDARIMPKDLLVITVNTTDPLVAAPFNLIVQSSISTSITATTQPALQQYLVDNNGEINFPVLGRLKVGGMTKREAENLIKERLKPYVVNEEPIVTVRMVNYKIAVLGEVNRPGMFTISNEKVNILEALAMACSTAWFSCFVLPSDSFCSLILALMSALYSSNVSNSDTSAANSSSIWGSSFALISCTVHLNTASFPFRSSAW